MKSSATDTLLPLQARFQQHLLGEADATDLLAGPPQRRALGLAIYANAYRHRLVDALADAYAKTQAVLGEQAFEGVALAYIDAHPPTTRSLRWFGGGLAQHLRETSADRVALAELAQLEWALRNAFDGPDSAVLRAADLAGMPPDAWATLRLTLVPTAELLRCRHNSVAVWQALDDDHAPPAFECGAEAVDWLVWRKDLQPHFRSLHPLEAALLRAMRAGAAFASACEMAQTDMTKAATNDDGQDPRAGAAELIGACLRQWVEDGVLSSVVMPPDAPANMGS